MNINKELTKVICERSDVIEEDFTSRELKIIADSSELLNRRN